MSEKVTVDLLLDTGREEMTFILALRNRSINEFSWEYSQHYTQLFKVTSGDKYKITNL